MQISNNLRKERKTSDVFSALSTQISGLPDELFSSLRIVWGKKNRSLSPHLKSKVEVSGSSDANACLYPKVECNT